MQKQINHIIEQLNDLKEDTLSGLTSEETKLLRMRFGLYNGKMMTCKEISEFIDLSETQIRTRIDNAINNLQDLVYVNVGDYINRIFFMLPIKSALPEDILCNNISRNINDETSVVEFLNIKLEYLRKICTYEEFKKLINYFHSELKLIFTDELEIIALNSYVAYGDSAKKLAEYKIYNLYDLIGLTKKEFLQINGIKSSDKYSIIRRLEDLNLCFKDDVPLVKLTDVKLLNNSELYSEYTHTQYDLESLETAEQSTDSDLFSKIKRLQEVQTQIYLLQKESINLTQEIATLASQHRLGKSYKKRIN